MECPSAGVRCRIRSLQSATFYSIRQLAIHSWDQYSVRLQGHIFHRTLILTGPLTFFIWSFSSATVRVCGQQRIWPMKSQRMKNSFETIFLPQLHSYSSYRSRQQQLPSSVVRWPKGAYKVLWRHSVIWNYEFHTGNFIRSTCRHETNELKFEEFVEQKSF